MVIDCSSSNRLFSSIQLELSELFLQSPLKKSSLSFYANSFYLEKCAESPAQEPTGHSPSFSDRTVGPLWGR